MPYAHVLVDRVYMLRWLDHVTVEDLKAQLADLAKAREELGMPLIYVSATGREVKPPQGEVRAALNRFAKDAEPYCEAVYLALEGEGFGAAAMRAVVGGVVFLAGQSRLVSIHKTLGEVVRQLVVKHDIDGTAVRKAAEAKGVLR